MLWFNRKIKHLPRASGPYIPGCMDVMLDYEKKGLFFRLMYPTNVEKDAKPNFKKWIPWIPNILYVAGMSTVLNIHVYLLRIAFWWYGATYIPVLYGEKVKNDEKMKCIILSHGLGGNRFLYSKISIDLASHGFLVVCLEHRDNSSCYTYYYNSKEDASRDKKTPINFKHIPFGPNHYERRSEQIKLRSDECLRTINMFKQINQGKIPENVLDNVIGRKKHDFSLSDLIGKIDVDNFTLIGHSFGAATVLYTAGKEPEIKQAILLDPWMFPVKNENLHETLNIPLLFINTHTFHIESNIKAMAKFMDKKDREMYTILYSTHENQTDSVMVSRSWLNFFMKKIDPIKAIEINNSLIIKFLHHYLKLSDNIDKYQFCLEINKNEFEEGLTKAWKK